MMFYSVIKDRNHSVAGEQTELGFIMSSEISWAQKGCAYTQKGFYLYPERLVLTPRKVYTYTQKG